MTSYGPPASHHLRWLASANCLLEIGEDVVELAAGSQRAGMGPEKFNHHSTVESDPMARPARPADAADESELSRLVELVRSTVPPVHPAGLPFIAAASASPPAGRRPPVAAPTRA